MINKKNGAHTKLKSEIFEYFLPTEILSGEFRSSKKFQAQNARLHQAADMRYFAAVLILYPF